jgi:O-antigen ligase
MNARALALVLLLGGLLLLLLAMPMALRVGEYLVFGGDKIYALLPAAGALGLAAWVLLLAARGEQLRLFQLFIVAFPLLSVLRRRLVFAVGGVELAIEVLLTLGLLAYILWTVPRGERVGWPAYFLALGLAVALSSAAMNGVVAPALLWLVLLELLLPAAFFLLVLRLVRSREALEGMVRSLLWTMLAFGALSLVWLLVLETTAVVDAIEVLTVQSRISGGTRRLLVGAGFVTANVGNRIFLLLLPVAIAAIAGRILDRRNRLHLFSILVCLYFIVATEHRAALLGMMMIFTLLFVFGQARNIRSWVKILALALVVVVLQERIVDYLGRRVLLSEGLLMDSSARRRLVLWDFALQLFRGSPLLGIGPFEYLRASINTPAQAISAHNYYATLLAEQGLLGLGAYLGLVGAIFARGLRGMRRLLDPGLRRLNFGLLLGLFTYQFALFFAGGRLTHNGVIYIHAIWWTLAGLLWVLPGIAAREGLSSAPAAVRADAGHGVLGRRRSGRRGGSPPDPALEARPSPPLPGDPPAG